MAEFMSFIDSGGAGGFGSNKASDVTVFMKRGQFYDQPELQINKIRRTNDNEDLFGMNHTELYKDAKDSESKALSDTWVKSEDTRKYAEQLTKFYPQGEKSDKSAYPLRRGPTLGEQSANSAIGPQQRPTLDGEFDNSEALLRRPTLAATRILYRLSTDYGGISAASNNLDTSESRRSGSSDNIRKTFENVNPSNARTEPERLSRTTPIVTRKMYYMNGEELQRPVTKLLLDDNRKGFLPMRIWNTPRADMQGDETDEVDEDSIVYKPV